MRFLAAVLLLACSVPVTAQSVAVATATGGGRSRSSVSVTVGFGQPARINRSVYRPVAIVEDSRCPVRVACVWRGRLLVDFDIHPGKRVRLEEGKPLAVPGGRLTLVSASPRSMSGETHPSGDYRFQLRFESP